MEYFMEYFIEYSMGYSMGCSMEYFMEYSMENPMGYSGNALENPENARGILQKEIQKKSGRKIMENNEKKWNEFRKLHYKVAKSITRNKKTN